MPKARLDGSPIYGLSTPYSAGAPTIPGIEPAPWQGVVFELTRNRKRYMDPQPPNYLGPLLPQWTIAAIDDLRKQVPLERSHVPGMKPCAYALLKHGLSVFMTWPLVRTLEDVVWEQSSIDISVSDHVRLSVKKHLESINLPPLSDTEEFKFTIDADLFNVLGKVAKDIGLGGKRERGKGRNPLASLCIQIALVGDPPGLYNLKSRERMRAHVEDVRERFTVEAESARVLLNYWKSRGPV